MDVVAVEAFLVWNNSSLSLYKTRIPKPSIFRLSTTTRIRRCNPKILHCRSDSTSAAAVTRFRNHRINVLDSRNTLRSVLVKSSNHHSTNPNPNVVDFVKKGLILAAACCVLGCCKAAHGIEYSVGLEQIKLSFINSLPKVLMVLKVLKEQGLILAALFGLSAFFSMAETSITTLWPWKVRELAEKESENVVFKMLRNDVTRFLTTILIGTTVVDIGATALVTEAATTIFGEAGVSAATGVMTVAILLLTEITPKSIAVHIATEVATFVAECMAFFSFISCWKSRNISVNGNAQVAWSVNGNALAIVICYQPPPFHMNSIEIAQKLLSESSILLGFSISMEIHF